MEGRKSMRQLLIVHELRRVEISSPISHCSYQVIRTNDWGFAFPLKNGYELFLTHHMACGVCFRLGFRLHVVSVFEWYCPTFYVVCYIGSTLQHRCVYPKTRAFLFFWEFWRRIWVKAYTGILATRNYVMNDNCLHQSEAAMRYCRALRNSCWRRTFFASTLPCLP